MQTRDFPQKKWIGAQMNPTGYRLKLDFLFLCPLKLGFRAKNKKSNHSRDWIPLVGMRGFEPPISRPPDAHFNRTKLHPECCSANILKFLTIYQILKGLICTR